mgnify:CR=1 FL=1
MLVDSRRRFGVGIVGPVADDPSWQAHDGKGFAKAAFLVDRERRVVTRPAGKRSISWLPNTYPKNGMVFEARFARKTIEHHEALHAARHRQTTPEFHALRAVSWDRGHPRAGHPTLQPCATPAISVSPRPTCSTS